MAGEQGRAEVAKDLKEQAARTFDDPKLRRLLKELKGVTQQEQRASATRSERQGSMVPILSSFCNALCVN